MKGYFTAPVELCLVMKLHWEGSGPAACAAGWFYIDREFLTNLEFGNIYLIFIAISGTLNGLGASFVFFFCRTLRYKTDTK